MLGVVIRWIIGSIRDLVARKSLEDKLGRKVASHEIFSLGANIEAAEITQQASSDPPQPLPPPQPMSRNTKIALASVATGFLFLAGVGVLFVVVMMMPEATYNRLNPFTPKAPAGAFPVAIAGFERATEPLYEKPRDSEYYGFKTYFKRGQRSISYALYVFKSQEGPKKRMDGRYFVGGVPIVKEKTDSRTVIVDKENGRTTIELTNGNSLIHLSAGNLADAIEFENALPYAALGLEQPPPRFAPVADVSTATPPKPIGPKKTTP
ncbi:MAG: hypothetical protein KA956_00105 [Pyrinomonadaceae bacterium]|nr:hypothetical protein [Pyrinomonadaceae bacterium]